MLARAASIATEVQEQMELRLQPEQPVIRWVQRVMECHILCCKVYAALLHVLTRRQAIVYSLQVLSCHCHRLLDRLIHVAQALRQLGNEGHKLPAFGSTASQLHALPALHKGGR